MGFWSKKTPQEKADSFDAQVKRSEKRANDKRRAGKYPYDLDAKVENKDRRKKK